MFVPKRASLVVLTFSLLLLAAGVAWYLDNPGRPKPRPPSTAPVEKGYARPMHGPTPRPIMTEPTPASTVFIDPMHKEQADRLNSDETTPQQDLEIVADFVQIYSKALGGNPTGGNDDITAALTGATGGSGRVFPPGHRTIVNGQLVDRWGSPYWFHPNSSSQMEIRSAGPDRQLFTSDDMVLNPSPSGLGATPAEASGAVR